MDIYKYQQLYRDKIVSEPVPHLFIISDEFAELKAQQPEFMEQLISAARIGRSLGVHLILATQKPSGVVDDQIWSNSKFRVCLKVQEKADSQDMIKCSGCGGAVTNGPVLFAGRLQRAICPRAVGVVRRRIHPLRYGGKKS